MRLLFVFAVLFSLNKIATQQWINFGVIQNYHGWAELRRTKIPALNFPVDNVGAPAQPQTRMIYPENERTQNAANYAAVAAKDNITTKIFWDVK